MGRLTLLMQLMVRGTLPKQFQEASQESRERSDPLNSYLLYQAP